MSDQLYLSLWFPNFELQTLPSALGCVMRQFAVISGTPAGKRVAAASVYPISFSESPTYQRIYVNDDRAEDNQDTAGSLIETAVAEATEQLHDDMAYEFEMRWSLWTPDSGLGADDLAPDARLDTLWRPAPATVKIIGFGPHFDQSAFEQNGHIRVDFGLDYPWVLDDEDENDEESTDLDEATEDDPLSDRAHRDSAESRRAPVIAIDSVARPRTPTPAPKVPEAAQYIQRNIEMLLAFTLSVEKHCGISSRLLWTESGEPLAEKLIARLQRLH